MNDLINNESVPEESDVVDVDAPVAETPEPTGAVEANADDIKKAYYASAQLADAQVAMDSAMNIATALELEVVFNFDTEKEFPTGYGIALIPIAKRVNNVNQTLGVAIAAVPDLATVEAHDHGKAFIMDSVIGSMVAKLANAVRPRGTDGDTASSIPFSVEDFITSNRAEGVLVAYRKFASAYVKVLKKKGLKYITESILRQVLQSAAFAEQQFPKIPQDKWIQILDSMMARAEAEGVAVGMLADWKQSRDSAELSDDDIDLSDLDFADDGQVAVHEQAPAQVA